MKIFDRIIKPIATYGCEIWGPSFKCSHEAWDKSPTESLHLDFCKNMLGIHRNTSNMACRAELGRFPLLLHIEKRAAKFWTHLAHTAPQNYCSSAFLYKTQHPESNPLEYLAQKHQLNSTTQSTLAKFKQIEKTMQDEYYHYWQEKI